MAKTDREKILGGFIWKFAERMSNQVVNFVITVVLARLLLPEQYGLVAMINIFVVFANVFVTSGFTSALIQNKNAEDIDFTTIFYCSLAMSLLVYGIVYISAPFIAAFYKMPDLCLLTRVYALSLIVSSYQTIQLAYVSRHMLFKKTFVSTFIGSLLSGVIGIYMAYAGYGVWALVGQYISNILINTLMLSTIVLWRPSLDFSVERAKGMMKYGSNVLLSDLVGKFFLEIRQLLIGRFYSPADLALYNRGHHIPNLVMSNIETALSSVLFPTMSNYSDNVERVKQLMSRAIKTSSYVTFFFLSILTTVSEPLIRLLLTDKWIECVPYMQIICISRMWAAVSSVNMQAIKSVGRSDELLKLEVFKKPIFILFVLIAVHISVFAVALTMPLYSIYAMLMNMKPSKKLLGYSYKEQIADLAPAFLMSLLVVAVTYPLVFLPIPDLLVIIVQFVVGTVVYVSTSLLTNNETFYYLKDIALGYLKKKK
ncbi:MAG: lipopolysaccharide biosynthesis protein [Paludibacteraceae bacterium]|nr:lipopolysaccharide biosynthesis protein [Paludibacteraceae bacterium]